MTSYLSLRGKEPDFAYPRDVLATADSLMKDAAKLAPEQAGAQRLYSLELISRASASIDPDSAFSIPTRIHAVADGEAYAPARAMMLLLEAATVQRIYDADRWKYDRVEIPETPVPTDMSAWSGVQFKNRISELVAEAVKAAIQDPKASIKSFEESLEGDEYSEMLTPTVALFVYTRGATLLEGYGQADDARKLREEALGYTEAPSESYFALKCALISGDSGSTAEEEYGEDEEEVQEDKVATALQNLYSQYQNAESARYVLVQLAHRWHRPGKTNEASKKLFFDNIALLDASLERYPKWYGNDELRSIRARLTLPGMTVTAQDMSSPGEELEVKITQNFTESAELEIRRLPISARDFRQAELDAAPVFKKIKLTPSGKNDFGCESTVKVTLPSTGLYVLVPVIGGPTDKPARWNTCIVEVTPWIPVKLSGVDNPQMAVVNSSTGAPEAGVNIQASERRSNAWINCGLTDGSGLASLKLSGSQTYPGVRLRRKDNVIEFTDIYFAKRVEPRALTSPEYSADVFTSRQLYHLGDTVEWAAVISEAERGAKSNTPTRIAAGRKVRVVFLDANWKSIDTLETSSDNYGRIRGSFKAREDGLTGTYSIEVYVDKDEIGRARITVSDFKLPTFEAKIERIERDKPEKGGVTLYGQATTYSGMPVAGAQVSVNLQATSPWWWRWFNPRPARQLGTLECRTDAQGNFSLEIPAEQLAAGKDYFMIQAEASVTAQGGETQICSRNFTLGKPYALNAKLEGNCLDAAKPLNVKFEASTPNEGEKAPAIALRWSLTQDDSKETPLIEGQSRAGERINIDASRLDAGIYVVNVEPVDAALADKSASTPFTLYNTATGDVPDGSVLFVPETVEEVNARGEGEVLIGVEEDDTWVYTATCQGGKLSNVELHKLQSGFHRIPVVASTERDVTSRVSIFTVKNCRIHTTNVMLNLPAAPTIRLRGESLRDKTTPGAPEHWKLRFENSEGKALTGAAIATMYNRALSSLQELSWPGVFPSPWQAATLLVGGPSAGKDSGNISGKLPNFKYISPELYRFANVDYFVVRNMVYTRMYKMSASATAGGAANGLGAVKEESAEMEMDMAMAMPESAELNEVVTVAGGADGGAGEKKIDFRVAELLQGFWKPELTTDADGVVELSFTAPNAIGAWTLQAFAWNESLQSARMSHDIVSAKPVMVQPTLPRFVRQGDEIIVTATLFNNSEDSCAITADFEFNDMTSGKAVASRRFEPVMLAAGESAVVKMALSVPTDASALTYKITAEGASFTDGEQGIIPVLESASTVIESETFYLNPERKEPYEFAVKNRPDFTYTLQYCQNPVWTIVKAMRGNSVNETMSTDIASSIFSNLAAIKIISDNPSIADAIREWKANPTQEALTSMLAKNEELKALVLDETPWVRMAESQTARMNALSDFLDKDAATKRVDRLFAKLQTLQSDGGLKWATWCDEASYWATETVLTTFGIARSMGLTEGYDKLIDSFAKPGLAYLDSSRYVRETEGTDLMFAYLHGLYMPGLTASTSAAKALIERTIKHISNEKSKLDTVEKAYGVLTLKAFGKDAAAAELARSLGQFGVVNEDTGMSFPSVDDIRGYATIIEALRETGAPAATLDAMRQWIIVRAQAMDDLGAYNPDYVIAAVMLTGTVWTDAAVSNYVSLNGKALEIGTQESATGYFSLRLPEVSGKELRLSVRPNGKTPSYGSVTAVGKLPATEIKARPGRDIAVEKRILVKRDEKWIDATTTEIEVGERVRVDLEIKAGRDMEYVSITDERAAGMEPVEQLPGRIWDGGTAFYRENRDASTRMFIAWLGKGTYHLSYEQTATTAGSVASGICTVQSQLAPELTAHSGGTRLTVKFREPSQN